MTTNPHRVSIGMPVYNGESFIAEAIESILKQTYRDFELIISDNASTDNTEDICKAYATKDQRISYSRNDQNLGPAANYNRVYELSSGEYFKWASHDDLCDPEFLQECVNVLDRDASVVLCYSQLLDIDEHGNRIGERCPVVNTDSTRPHERFRSLIRRDSICDAVFGVIRANVLRKTALIRSYPDCDRVLLSELGLHGRLYQIPEHLFFRRQHSGTSVNKYRSRRERAKWFNPKAGWFVFPHWRQFLEYMLAIRRSPLVGKERLRCYREMWTWIKKHRRWLKRDIFRGN